MTILKAGVARTFANVANLCDEKAKSSGKLGKDGQMKKLPLTLSICRQSSERRFNMSYSKSGLSNAPSFDLGRYQRAQAIDYEKALSEIRQGKKQGHWMWYIFPQIEGLGHSDMSWYFAISGLEEARAYMRNEVLGARLLEISQALLALETDNPTQVMGYPDDMKLCSCMTLFAIAAPQYAVFKQVLEKYYHGRMDPRTCIVLKEQAAGIQTEG